MTNPETLIGQFDLEKECTYRERRYLVRDNGAILRLPKEGGRVSKYDNVWTFGNKDEKNGYMMFSGGVRVHQVVATAFHGEPADPNMVVDHIDTNRCNNRPENLRWVTRLENALNNPATRKKIIFWYGSIEAFLKNPSLLRDIGADPNISWMRTVSKEEAAKCLRNVERWAAEDSKPATGVMGEFIFKDNDRGGDNGFGGGWKDWMNDPSKQSQQRDFTPMDNIEDYLNEEPTPTPSLTPNALQVDWKIPTEFPLCPETATDTPLKDYANSLKEGAVFCRNSLYESLVVSWDLSDDGMKLGVITSSAHVKGTEGFCLSVITFSDGMFIHYNEGSYFEEIGAEKYRTLALGKEWTGGDVFDDYVL